MGVGMKFIVGKNIYLRLLESGDADGNYRNWFNDEEVCGGNSHHVFPQNIEDIKEYITTSRSSRNNLILAIILQDGNRHVGNIALQNINTVVHSAELSIVIGEKTHWGMGIGKEAFKLMCKHGFDEMNLSRIGCGTFETNIGMIKVAESVGMKE